MPKGDAAVSYAR